MDNKSPEAGGERTRGRKGVRGSDGDRRVRMKTSEQSEVENLYDEDKVVGESMRDRRLRERRAEVQLVADVNHAEEDRKWKGKENMFLD